MAEQQLAKKINVLRSAEQGLSLSGAFNISDFPRLVSTLTDSSGEIHVDLQFGIDEEGLRYIKGPIKTEVEQTCQRCMQPVKLAIEAELCVSPVLSDAQASSIPSHYEPVIVEREGQELLPIIEDELILQLPMIALHDNETCRVKPIEESQTTTDSVNNAFREKLSTLK
jgi:uncharacterized protein